MGRKLGRFGRSIGAECSDSVDLKRTTGWFSLNNRGISLKQVVLGPFLTNKEGLNEVGS
jgi:hypothetical protein